MSGSTDEIKKEIRRNYTRLLYQEHSSKVAMEMTADLVGTDEETVRAVLEDMKVIPVTEAHFIHHVKSHMAMLNGSVDSYYRVLTHKRDRLLDEMEIRRRELEDTEEKMRQIEDYCRGILELRDEKQKTD